MHQLSSERVVVFDLGGVIVSYDPMVICARLSQVSQYSPRDIYELGLTSEPVQQYEEGRITTGEFYECIKKVLKLDIDFDDFKELWSDIFVENREVSQLIRKLKQEQYILYLLSNTNEMHFHLIQERFDVLNVFHRFILSYQVGYRKPKVGIFEVALARSGLPASSHVYVDDIEEYVSVARSLGMRGITFRSCDQLRRKLQENGIM